MKLSKTETVYFESFAHKLEVKSPDELQISEASLKGLKALLANKDMKQGPFTYLVGDLAVGALINKNDDGVTLADAVRVHKRFEGTPIDVEHNRNKVVGYIIKSELTDPETKAILTEEEALAYTKPINMSIAFVFWPHVDPELAQVVHEVSNEKNNSHGLISLSWEMSFDEYVLLTGSKNVFEGKVITDDAEIEKIEANLRVNGGTGLLSDDETPVYRLVTGANLTPLGAGLVVKPAADVQGISQITVADLEEPKEEDDEDDEDNHPEECQCEDCKEEEDEDNNDIQAGVDIMEKLNFLEQENQTLRASVRELNEKSSQNKNNTVNTTSMKINSVSDITNAGLEESVASEISRFITTELAKKADEYTATLEAKEKEAAAALSAANEAAEKATKASEQLEVLSKELESLKNERASEKIEADFNARMGALDEEFELSDEDRSILASQVKGLSDEAYVSWKTGFDVIAKEKNKEFVKKKKDEAEEEKKKAFASVTDPLELITKKINDTIPSTAGFSEDVLASYREAFSIDKGVKFVK